MFLDWNSKTEKHLRTPEVEIQSLRGNERAPLVCSSQGGKSWNPYCIRQQAKMSPNQFKMSYNGRNRHQGPRSGHGRGGKDLDIQMANGPRSTNNGNSRTRYNQHHKNRQGRDWHNWSNDDLAFTNERRPLVHEDKGSSGSEVSDLDTIDNDRDRDSSSDLTTQQPRHPGNQHHSWNRGQYRRPRDYDGARYQGPGQPDRSRGHPWNQQDRGQAKSATAGGNRHPMFDHRMHPAGQRVYGGNSNENNQNGQRRPNGIYVSIESSKMCVR